MTERLARRVLLLGWDAADWKVIQPLLDRGELPNLRKLIDGGVMGKLASLHPMLSPMLWTTVATGRRPERHGVLGFIEPRPDGLGVRPVAATSVRARTLWAILEAAGLKSAVVGWYATHPAPVVPGIVVSDRFAAATGPDFAGWPMPAGAVSPEPLAGVMRDLRVHPADIDAEQIRWFVPELARVDQETDRRLETLARRLAECATIHAAGTYLAEHVAWDLLAVYYDTIDRVCHEFMRYRAPQMEQVSDEDHELYRDVVDRCYRLHDLMLGRYLRLVGPDTGVVIVSDHGFHSDHLRPRVPAGAAWGQPLRWHRPLGILAAAGPGIQRDALALGASLLDVAPTVLTLLGLPVARDMEGRVLRQLFEQPVEPAWVPTYERPAEEVAAEAGDPEADPWAAQQVIRHLAGLGYVEMPDEDAARAIEQARLQRLAILAEVHFAKQEHAVTTELYEEVLRHRPDHVLARLRLAQCRLAAGDVAGCRALVDEVTAGSPEGPWAVLARGLLHFHLGEWDEALACFRRTAESGAALPRLQYRIGVICLRRERWQEAEEAFRQCLEIDGDDAEAYSGLGLALHRQGRYEEAVENQLRSISLLYTQPDAHYRLGLSLAATGQLDGALESFQTAVRLRPALAGAHEGLAAVYRAQGNVEQAARHLSRAQTLQTGAGSAAGEG